MQQDVERARVDYLEQKLSRVAASASAAGLASTFVFRPGGLLGKGIYPTWASLYAALPAASAQGNRPPTTIQIDDSLVTPAVIPAGDYNLDGVTFTAVASFVTLSGGAALDIADGVTIAAGQLSFEKAILVTYRGAAPCLRCSGAAQEVNLYLEEDAFLICAAAGPFLAVTGGFGFFDAHGGGVTIGDGVHPVLTMAAPGALEVLAYGNTILEANAITGAGAIVFWDSFVPGAQGAGVSVTQVGGAFYNGIELAGGQVSGASGAPWQYAESAPISVAAGHVLTADEAANPILVLTGVLAAGETLTVPAAPGATWDIDLTGVTLGAHALTFSAGGATAAITAAQLAATGATGCRIGVVGVNTVTRFS
jgi:hypothetical protein